MDAVHVAPANVNVIAPFEVVGWVLVALFAMYLTWIVTKP